MRTFFILIFLFSCTLVQIAHALPDSLRVEKVKGRKFIVHRVEPKETLYSISRRYNVSIDDLYKVNPSIEQNLQMYDELMIPLKKKRAKAPKMVNSTSKITNNFHVVKTGETLYAISKKYNLSIDELKALNRLTSNNISLGDTLGVSIQKKLPVPTTISTAEDTVETQIRHVVKASETLYSISIKYNTSVDSLTKWNRLDNQSLSIGQQLMISSNSRSKPIELSIPSQDSTTLAQDSSMIPVEKVPIDTIYLKTDNRLFRTSKNEVDGQTQIVEEGFAMKIEGTDFTSKFLALHRTAPMGSSVNIKSQMTGQTITVQVVGYLPPTALNQNLLIRLSSAAYKKLGALDSKIPVTSIYIEE